MKENAVPQDVVFMDFDRLTLVQAEKGGKHHAPINPKATLVAVKGAEVEQPKVGAFGAFRNAMKALGLVKEGEANKASAIEDATSDAMRSAMIGAVYEFENDVYSILGCDHFTPEAKSQALQSALEELTMTLSELSGEVFAKKCAEIETAMKAGARHSKDDKSDIQSTHDKIGKAIGALQKAHEATGRLLSDTPNDAAQSGGGGSTQTAGTASQQAASKSGDSIQENEVDEATKAALVKELITAAAPVIGEAVKSAVAEATKAAAPAPAVTTEPSTPAPAPAPAEKGTEEPPKPEASNANEVAAAVKAALAEAIPQIVEASKAAATDAVKTQFADAVKSARENGAVPAGHETGNAQKSAEEIRTEARGKDFSGAVATLLQTNLKK